QAAKASSRRRLVHELLPALFFPYLILPFVLFFQYHFSACLVLFLWPAGCYFSRKCHFHQPHFRLSIIRKIVLSLQFCCFRCLVLPVACLLACATGLVYLFE
ncbi:unnamed protein product, partial [Oikopleura dioica]